MAILYNSNYDLTCPWSDICIQVALAANAELTFTIPGASTVQYSARFTYTATSNVFVARNAVPVIPGGGTVGTQIYSEFRPGCDRTQRYFNGGDVVHFITPDVTAYVGMRLMQLT
jgi:hypothetical protein